MKVKIFTEGGHNIGLGHISRCSALYDEGERRGIDTKLFIHGNTKNLDFLNGRIFENINWLSENYLINNINKMDYCIIDSYLASERIYSIISSKSKNVLFIDDNSRISYPKGIMVNPSLSTDSLRYPSNDEILYLLGHKYIILRSPFINIERITLNKVVKEVLITMGGSDFRELTPKILNNICVKYPEIKFNVIIGNAFSNLKHIKRNEQNNVEFYLNIDEELMEKLMIRSDVAITSAGQTIYELLATQTPFIAIKVVDNQNNNINGLMKIHTQQSIIEYDNKRFDEKLDSEFKEMLCYEKRKRYFNVYKNVVDGFGTRRIFDILLRGVSNEK